jgi:site-specific DNA-methyltransferase (cytosine-N4-specific)
MIDAGCPVGGIVLDPFMGSGTTGQVAEDRGRLWIGFDLDERNATLIRKRTAQTSLLGLVGQ